MHDFQIAKILSDLSISGIKENLHKTVKAKFHYASWFEAGSKPNSITLSGSNRLRTSFQTSSEPASVMEFGFYRNAVLTEAVTSNIQLMPLNKTRTKHTALENFGMYHSNGLSAAATAE